LEPVLVPGTWRFSVSTVLGTGFEGNHLSRSGAAADGSPVTVPEYRHEVSLDYTRIEVGLEYALSERWDLTARVPWEQKEQRAGLTLIEPATASEVAAMQRDIDLHHRSVTLRGIGDIMLLGRRRRSGLWRDGDVLAFAAGTTLPTGDTVENPYDLGDRGLEHLHIQFGTGTFDPLIEATYVAPLAGRLSAGANFASRLPLYENSRTFRAPPEATLAAHLAHQVAGHVRLRLGTALYGQAHGSWDGVRDENTGLVALSSNAGVTVEWAGMSVSADVRYPIAQRTLDAGDAFELGPTFIVSVRSPAVPRMGRLLRR
jgi:hypothetical protein